jgi:hypothetical protein
VGIQNGIGQLSLRGTKQSTTRLNIAVSIQNNIRLLSVAKDPDVFPEFITISHEIKIASCLAMTLCGCHCECYDFVKPFLEELD